MQRASSGQRLLSKDDTPIAKSACDGFKIKPSNHAFPKIYKIHPKLCRELKLHKPLTRKGTETIKINLYFVLFVNFL